MHSVIMYDVAPGVPLYYRVHSYGGPWSAVRRFEVGLLDIGQANTPQWGGL
jgi:hypothetical protein